MTDDGKLGWADMSGTRMHISMRHRKPGEWVVHGQCSPTFERNGFVVKADEVTYCGAWSFSEKFSTFKDAMNFCVKKSESDIHAMAMMFVAMDKFGIDFNGETIDGDDTVEVNDEAKRLHKLDMKERFARGCEFDKAWKDCGRRHSGNCVDGRKIIPGEAEKKAEAMKAKKAKLEEQLRKLNAEIAKMEND